jgi:hypothetical protein
MLFSEPVKMTSDPLSVNCLHWNGDSACNAHEGEECVWTEEHTERFHKERIASAELSGSPDDYVPTREEFMVAIESDPNIPA